MARFLGLGLLICFSADAELFAQTPPSIPTTNNLEFFTSASDVLLRSTFGGDTNHTITNLWVYSSTNPAVCYSSQIHRCLQVAANMSDAVVGGSNGPSIFKPIFRRQTSLNVTNLYITGYQQESKDVASIAMPAVLEPWDRSLQSNDVVWGVPFVASTDPSIPYVEYSLAGGNLTVARKLIFTKNGTSIATNQQYLYSATNDIELIMTGGFSQLVQRDITVIITNQFLFDFTNEFRAGTNFVICNSSTLQIPANRWLTNHSIQILGTNQTLVPWSSYDDVTKVLSKYSVDLPPPVPGFPVHQWGLSLLCQCCIAVFDSKTRQMLDFVNFGSLVSTNDLNQVLLAMDPSPGNPWLTNGANDTLSSPPSLGVLNQIAVCFGSLPFPARYGSDVNVSMEKYSLQSWWTNASSSASRTAFFLPVTTIAVNRIYQAPNAMAHYTLGDMVEPLFLGTKFYFQTNGCSAVLYELIQSSPAYPLGVPVRTNNIAPLMVISNDNAYAFDCNGVVLGPFSLAGTIPLTLSLADHYSNFAFTWNSKTNRQYQIKVSTNLPDFYPLSQVTTYSTQTVFIDPLPIQSAPTRFFRVRTLP